MTSLAIERLYFWFRTHDEFLSRVFCGIWGNRITLGAFQPSTYSFFYFAEHFLASISCGWHHIQPSWLSSTTGRVCPYDPQFCQPWILARLQSPLHLFPSHNPNISWVTIHGRLDVFPFHLEDPACKLSCPPWLGPKTVLRTSVSASLTKLLSAVDYVCLTAHTRQHQMLDLFYVCLRTPFGVIWLVPGWLWPLTKWSLAWSNAAPRKV